MPYLRDGYFAWPAPGWPGRGDKVTYLSANGHDYQREAADKLFTKGQELTVINCEIGGSSSTYEFEGVVGKFNTVMFRSIPKPEPTQSVWVATIIEDGQQKELYVCFTEAGVDANLKRYIQEHWNDRASTWAPNTFPEDWDSKRLQCAYFDGHFTQDLHYSGPMEVGA